MRVAIYIRVSTEEQANEGYSISAQNQRLKAYCIAQDWSVAGLYVDEGISAKNTKRPKLQEMLKDIKAGKIDCVLVYRLDRLTRSVFDLYKLLELFEKYNCKFKSATEVYDTTTAMGRLFITIVGALAQWERENLGERVKMGYQEKVRQGKYAGVIEPFGYKLNQKEGTMTIIEDEAKVVRMIYQLYIEGMGCRRICAYLNKHGYRTKKENQWNEKPVMEILKNPLYKGTIRWGKEYENTMYVESSIPAIIENETFEMVQKTIERRRDKSPKQISSKYIFASTLRCNSCDSSMTGSQSIGNLANGDKVKYKNYRCKKRGLGICYGSKSISESKLEKAFLKYLNQFNPDVAFKEVAADTSYFDNSTNSAVDLEKLKKELEQIEKRKKKWQYAWANDMMSDEDFDKRTNEERELEDQINAQIAAYEEPEKIQTNFHEIYNLLKDIESNWNTLSDEQKKSFVQMFVNEIHYDYDENNTLYIKNIDFNY